MADPTNEDEFNAMRAEHQRRYCKPFGEVMADEQACCGCLNVEYQAIDNGDGTMSERWCCASCGCHFVREPLTLADIDRRVRQIEGHPSLSIPPLLDSEEE